MPPETKFAHGPDGAVGYQVFGDGPLDLVVTPGFVSHLDLNWTLPSFTQFAEQLASFARVIIFSAMGFSSLAFCSVVTILSCSKSEVTMFLNIALRCALVRPSFLPDFPCLMILSSTVSNNSQIIFFTFLTSNPVSDIKGRERMTFISRSKNGIQRGNINDTFFYGDEIQKIKDLALKRNWESKDKGVLENKDVLSDYIGHVSKFTDDINNLKIVGTISFYCVIR